MKFGLENISRLCAALDHPERAFRPVIVAGTNGKGSVTAMVHHALVAAGHRAARYTSPHLERLEERYVIGSAEIDRTRLLEAAETVRGAIDQLERTGGLTAPPTFFECATAMAFEAFRDAGVTIAVLEVGLGGRLDATNVVTPIAAAITSIDFDHQAQLGNTLASIAFEKAGVVKPGIPVVAGPLPAEAEAVIADVCRERRAHFIHAAECVDLNALLGESALALAGTHQRVNAEVAACLLRQIDAAGVAVPQDAIKQGLTGVSWPGRLEHLRHGASEILLDAAHNPAGARALAEYVAGSPWQGGALVFGVMHDKDARAMLHALAPVCSALICTTPDTPRAMPAETLAGIARTIGSAAWTISSVPAPADALALAARAHRRVIVAGSIFLIGPVRGILRPR
jgi:dihydrofolate synthase/folylpolyglutamate synthase